jgi:hypothetical protein
VQDLSFNELSIYTMLQKYTMLQNIANFWFYLNHDIKNILEILSLVICPILFIMSFRKFGILLATVSSTFIHSSLVHLECIADKIDPKNYCSPEKYEIIPLRFIGYLMFWAFIWVIYELSIFGYSQIKNQANRK